MNAINWLISKATKETLSDGTVSYYKKCDLPNRMVKEIKAASTIYRDHGKTVSYGHSVESNTENYSWNLEYNYRYGIATFTYSDYTIPAGINGNANMNTWVDTFGENEPQALEQLAFDF